MHSNSHLGISLAAMTHVAAAVPNLTYALDTHWPWKFEDVIVDGALDFVDGAIAVPSAPGLGVELDHDALAHLHAQYVACGITERSDTSYMQSFHPDYRAELPRW
jgi:glucarate dehydratase